MVALACLYSVTMIVENYDHSKPMYKYSEQKQ